MIANLKCTVNYCRLEPSVAFIAISSQPSAIRKGGHAGALKADG